jgi:glycerophosphoryl diester phosphodiesterase
LVITKDEEIILLKDNNLIETTNIKEKEEFQEYFRTKEINGKRKEGYFSEDINLKEIKKLKLKDLKGKFQNLYEVLTLKEFLKFQKEINSKIGIYFEIKYSNHFKMNGKNIEKKLIQILKEFGYIFEDNIINKEKYFKIISNEVTNLKNLKNEIHGIELVQLINENLNDIQNDTGLPYSFFLTNEGLNFTKQYSNSISISKLLIFNKNSNFISNNNIIKNSKLLSNKFIYFIKIKIN